MLNLTIFWEFIHNFQSWDKGILCVFLGQSNFFLNTLLIPYFTGQGMEKYHQSFN